MSTVVDLRPASRPSFRNRFSLSSNGLAVVCALAFVALYNLSTWRALAREVPAIDLRSALFFGSFAVMMWVVFTLLFTAVSFKYIFKPVLTVVALASASAAYFMNSYGVSIDYVMIQNMLETNTSEAGALFSWQLLTYLLVLGVLPIVLIWRVEVVYAPFWRGLRNKLLLMAGVLVLGVAATAPFYSTYGPLFRGAKNVTHYINPTNYLYGLNKYARQRWGTKENLVVAPIGLDAAPGPAWATRPKKALVVFVVGETGRADHFSLNGYPRDTNPELERLGPELLNYTNVHSCGTSTAVSVPCMFSNFPRVDYSDRKAKTHEGLLDVLNRAGVAIWWRDNNSDCKGTCLRISHETMDPKRPSPFCNGDYCQDEVMLENVQQYIDAQKGNTFIVLHSMGSHGPEYYERYPKNFERFTPVCKTNQLNSCSHDELINAYDNSILYTDHFLAQVIDLLKRNADKRDTAMLYVSDHGESLGENGMYLHAAPYAIAPETQTHVPMVAWMSPGASTDWGINLDCMRAKKDAVLSHDNIFHTFLGLFDVDTSVYKPGMDMFQSCRTSAG